MNSPVSYNTLSEFSLMVSVQFNLKWATEVVLFPFHPLFCTPFLWNVFWEFSFYGNMIFADTTKEKLGPEKSFVSMGRNKTDSSYQVMLESYVLQLLCVQKVLMEASVKEDGILSKKQKGWRQKGMRTTFFASIGWQDLLGFIVDEYHGDRLIFRMLITFPKSSLTQPTGTEVTVNKLWCIKWSFTIVLNGTRFYFCPSEHE